MRLRVTLDVRQPLKREKRVRRNQGASVLCKFRYEKLPNFCYICGKLGHIDRYCEVLYRVSGDKVVRLWDEELRAPPRKQRAKPTDRYLLKKDSGQESNGQNAGKGKGPWREGVSAGRGEERMPKGVQALLGNFGASPFTATMEILHGHEAMGNDMAPLVFHDDRKRRRDGGDPKGQEAMEGITYEGGKPSKSPKKTGRESKNVLTAGRQGSVCQSS
ncbi:hypothetical protein LINPERHAP1_LOCUS2066 [Linum perenne]